LPKLFVNFEFIIYKFWKKFALLIIIPPKLFDSIESNFFELILVITEFYNVKLIAILLKLNTVPNLELIIESAVSLKKI